MLPEICARRTENTIKGRFDDNVLRYFYTTSAQDRDTRYLGIKTSFEATLVDSLVGSLFFWGLCEE